MSYNSAGLSRRVTGSSTYAATSFQQPDGVSRITALAAMGPMSHTSDGSTFSDLKLQRALYGTSAPSAPASTTAHSVASLDTPLAATAAESRHSLIDPQPNTPLVHAEVAHAPWYAPAGWNAHAQSLLRAFATRSGRESPVQNTARDVDSGLRLYNEPALPPPYTPE